MSSKKLLFYVFFLTIFSIKAVAQSKAGKIEGYVHLTSGKAAEAVTVQLTGTKKAVLTDENGRFTIQNVTPGSYDLKISLVGYNEETEHVTVDADAVAKADITLNITDNELEEIVISSRTGYKSNTPSASLRLNEPLLEAPQNIQIVTGKSLGDQQVISMSDGVVRNVSGTVRAEHWGDLYANVNSRGSQLQAFRNGFNVVNSYWGPLTEDMSFVDHIEFVKGPSSFMLASGDPGGLYNVVTKKPTGATKQNVELTAGSYNLYRGTADLDGSLSKDKRLLYRLNVMGQTKGSFRANEFNNRYSVAPVLSYQLDNKTKITLEYTLQHAKMSDVGSYYVFSANGFATLPRDKTFLPDKLEPTTIDDQSSFLNIQHQFSDNWKLTVQASYFHYRQIGSSMWPTSVTGDSVQRSVGSWDALSNMLMGQAFVNGEANTGAIHHRILGGVDAGNKKYWADWGQSFNLEAQPVSLYSDLTGVPSAGYPSFDHNKSTIKERGEAIGAMQNQKYASFYLQDELGFLNNTVRLTLAGRYTYLEQYYYGGEAARHFTPRVALSISVDKSTSVYGLYDQAFIPQSGVLSSGKSVQPVTGNNMEVGIKKDWANGNWNTTASVYRIIKNNELTTDPNSPPNSGLSVELGQKRAQGFEFDLRGKIVNGLNLIANYALTDSRVTKVAKDVTAYEVDQKLPTYAKHTANIWLSYKAVKGTLKGVGVSGGVSALAGRVTYWEPSPDPNQKLPDYMKLDGGLFWENNKMRIAANVFNMLNKFTYSGSYYSYLSAYYWQADAPRTVRLSVSYSF